MTAFNIRTANLRAVNSMTKYPSIPTYHALDPKNGSLTGGVITFGKTVIGTEKVDGTNARIILLPDGTYLLGSREELLYAQGDLIGNPSQGIVDALKSTAEDLTRFCRPDEVAVLFVELYGGKIGGNAKQYTTKGDVGWRLFDVALIRDYAEMLDWPTERFSTWRDAGSQGFVDETDLHLIARQTGLELTPRLFEIEPTDLPTGIDKMHAFLTEWLPQTLVALGDATPGRSEGIVLRTRNRSTIAKARFQDYERTLRRRR